MQLPRGLRLGAGRRDPRGALSHDLRGHTSTHPAGEARAGPDAVSQVQAGPLLIPDESEHHLFGPGIQQLRANPPTAGSQVCLLASPEQAVPRNEPARTHV